METSILTQFVLAVIVVGVWRHFGELAEAATRSREWADRERLPGDGRTEVE